jgi:hypothetical protein
MMVFSHRLSDDLLRRIPVIAAMGWALLAIVGGGGTSQLRGDELEAKGPSMQAFAIAGEPFGVATIEIPLPLATTDAEPSFLVFEKNSRAFYPTFSVRNVELELKAVPPSSRRIGQGRIIERLRNSIREMQKFRVDPQVARISFLFKGDQPLEIQLVGTVPQRLTIPVERDKVADRNSAMESWWQDYLASTHKSLDGVSLYSAVPAYLVNMLHRRTNFSPTPKEYLSQQPQKKVFADYLKDFDSRLLDTLKLLGGMEEKRLEILNELLSGSRDTEAKYQLPVWEKLSSDRAIERENIAADVPIEPLAKTIPPEWLYLRFGSFSNYLWFQSLTDRNGGDIAQMFSLKGVSFNSSKRIETLLNMRLNTLAKLFGDAVIEDMAIVGRDLYLQEGPSIGVLFRAKNRMLLLSSLQSDRSTEAKRRAGDGCKIETMKIAGREVSFLSTPDMQVRSYLVAEGSHLLVTSSRAMVERFLEVADGATSMADTASFRLSRQILPEKNQYSIFAYLSPEFLEGLVSPQYQIEVRRRLEALARLDLVEMASWIAKSEGLEATGVKELQEAGLLPLDFDLRADGGSTLEANGIWQDSIRGTRGSFVPVADIDPGVITEVEKKRYEESANYFREQWKQMDPILVGIRRFADPEKANREQVVIEGYVAPFISDKYGWLADILGPPTDESIVLPSDDIANLQVFMHGAPGSSMPDHQLFVGVKDMLPPDPAETQGLLRTLIALQSLPGYVGAWPAPGLLDLIFPATNNRVNADGFSRILLGLWRWQGSGFSILSFDRSILEGASATVRPERVDDAAQVRLQVQDLTGTQLEPWLNRFWYRRGLEASKVNTDFLNQLGQQFHLPSGLALATAEKFVGSPLQCPVGGTFQYELLDDKEIVSESKAGSNDNETGLGRFDDLAGQWKSSAWPKALGNPKTAELAADYQAPWISWFRGGKIHFSQQPDTLVLVGRVELEQLPQKEAEAPRGEVPQDQSIFSLPFQMFGKSGEKGKK